MEAKEFLSQMKKINALIENKLAEVQQLKNLVTNTTGNPSPDKVQTDVNPHRMAATIAKYMDLESEIDADIDRLIDARKDIIRVIEQLSATEYDVLHKLYVQDYTLQDIADKHKRSYSWAAAKHDEAVISVQIILDSRKNNKK